MRRTPGWNIQGVSSCDCNVQCAMPKGSAAMGSVLPRENSGVDAVPCRMLTQSTGSRGAWVLALFASLAPCAALTAPSSVNTALTAASPDVFRNARLLGPFDLSFTMRDTFPQTMLYQNRLIHQRLLPA